MLLSDKWDSDKARKNIRDYWENSKSEFTIRCLVGMLETGEASEDDFIAVGGIDLWDQVEQAKRKGYKS